MSSLKFSPLQQMQDLVERLRLDDRFKVSCNDLAVASEAAACSFEEFLVSIEHLAFYLRSQEASGIRNPKAWMLKKLRSGYFGEPADFISWEVEQETEKMRAKQRRIDELRRVQRENFGTDFELWHLQQTTEQLAVIKNELEPGFSLPLSSPMGRALLRRHFARTTGRLHLLEEDESTAAPFQRR